MRDEELLAAYVDGVTELTHDERERVERSLRDDEALRTDEAATRDLLGQLRELEPAGNEPDWNALERSIRAAVGPDVPRPWWRRWQWILPGVATLAAGTAILALVVRTPPVAEPVVAPSTPDAAPVAVAPAQAEPVEALWLDGHEVALAPGADEAMLDELDARLDDELPAPKRHKREGRAADVGFVVSDLRWVDNLDDAALDRLDRELEREVARRKKG